LKVFGQIKILLTYILARFTGSDWDTEP